MKERFENLYKLPNNLYVENSPVIIVAGSLLKDTESSNLIIQLKYHSLSDKKIKALKIKLNVYDVTKQLLGDDIEYQYLDLSILQGQEFGANKAIIVSDLVARSFSIKEFTVIYENNEQWVSTIPLVQLVNSQSLSTELKDPEVVKQYRLATNDNANYVPKEMLGLWQCACGEWNKQSLCNKCRLSKIKIFEAFDFYQLNKDKCARLEREAESAALIKKQQEEQENKRKKTVKKLIIIGASLLVLIGLIIAFIKTKPIITMKNAEKEIANGNYDEAMSMILNLNNGDMTRSITEKILQKIYNDIDAAIENEDFQLAINIAEENASFINTSASIKNIQSACPHNRTYDDKKAPTCEESGYDRDVCEACGYYDSGIIRPLGHSYTEAITKEATCTEKGVKSSICEVCGDVKEGDIDAIGHKYNEAITKEATCTEKGVKSSTCEVCGDVKESYINATGNHTYKKSVVKNPSCDIPGELSYICETCGDSYVESVKAIGHNWSVATCTEDGACKNCGKITEKAHGHDWKDYSRYDDRGLVCTICDIDYPVKAAIKGYNFPYTDEYIHIESLIIKNVRVEEEGEAKVLVELAGYAYKRVTHIRVMLLDQNGNPVLNEFGLEEYDAAMVIAEAGENFDGLAVLYAPNEGTYYVKIVDVW